MDKFTLINHSSEKMPEVKDKSVDLIVFSPPYNTVVCYDSVLDTLSWEEYRKLMEKVISECFRVLKKDGVLFIESADTVFSQNMYVSLAGMLQKIALDKGFYLFSRNISFVRTNDKIEVPDHGWNEDFISKRNAHSNSQQHLAFSKVERKFVDGKVNYFNYPFEHDYTNENNTNSEHPCPYPKEIIDFVLDNYFKEGFTVLDAFAGTCGLGEEVLKRGGKFIGFDLSKKYLEIGRKRMEKL